MTLGKLFDLSKSQFLIFRRKITIVSTSNGNWELWVNTFWLVVTETIRFRKLLVGCLVNSTHALCYMYKMYCYLLQVTIQFSQHHLLKRFFFPMHDLVSFVKIQIVVVAWVCVWVFHSVPLVLLCFWPVPCCFYYYGSAV
jgi:hypothetical protein